MDKTTVHDLECLGSVENVETIPAANNRKPAIELQFRMPGGDRYIVRADDPRITDCYPVITRVANK